MDQRRYTPEFKDEAGSVPERRSRTRSVRDRESCARNTTRAGGLIRSAILRAGTLILGVLSALCVPAYAAGAELAEIIIENVLIAEPGETGTKLVSIQIVKGRVAAVSEGPIAAAEGVRVVDADQGYLLGNLEVGLPSQFILLDQNPAENFEVLMDTQAHTTFSISEGQIVKDALAVSVATPGSTQVAAGSISHQPAPVGRPRVEDSDARWNAFDGDHVSALLSSAIFLDGTSWFSQNSDSLEQPGVGDLSDYQGGTIRALRFGLTGELKLKRPWQYTVWIATNEFDDDYDPLEDESITFFDYRLDIPFSDRTTLSIGKQKEPI
jgi:phosphate-selective porin OprO/OprP